VRFETRFTYDFIKRSLPPHCARILEVGCGTGELAAQLTREGFSVVAIDTDREVIATARRGGVDARFAQWPYFRDGLFDAILFTRSLHHIHPLDAAVQGAGECLRGGGRVVVEDFAYESADKKTLRWFASASRILAAAGLLVERDEFLDQVLRKPESLPAWRKAHDYDLHTAAAIGAELGAAFDNLATENAAYYFRYLAKAMGGAERCDAVAQALANQETALIADAAIIAFGRRYIAARARSSRVITASLPTAGRVSGDSKRPRSRTR
jgi:SAM-dependent methyltransferase